MFESLSDRLQSALGGLRGKGKAALLGAPWLLGVETPLVDPAVVLAGAGVVLLPLGMFHADHLLAHEAAALALAGLAIWAVAVADDKGLFMAVTIATAIAFFSMVGFEDSVNMVEETENPRQVFPRIMLTGLGIAVLIYMLVAVSVVLVLPSRSDSVSSARRDSSTTKPVPSGLRALPASGAARPTTMPANTATMTAM